MEGEELSEASTPGRVTATKESCDGEKQSFPGKRTPIGYSVPNGQLWNNHMHTSNLYRPSRLYLREFITTVKEKEAGNLKGGMYMGEWERRDGKGEKMEWYYNPSENSI